jgi:N-acetylmuramoyl-L-alanine amidase
MWRILATVLAAFLLMPNPEGIGASAAVRGGHPGAVVSDVRVGTHESTTRFVMDMSAPVTARLFTLVNPYRVVIDLPEIGWRLPPRPLPAAKGLFAKVRYGLFKPGTTRVVIEVSHPVKVSFARFMAAPDGTGNRLVIDFVKTDAQSYLQAARSGSSRKSVSATDLATVAAPAGVAAAAAEPALAIPTPKPTLAALIFTPPPRKPGFRREKPLIVLDPGHGGADPGAIGAAGTYEKHVTLKAAREFKAHLEKSGRFRVVLTRHRDVYIPLRDRVAFGRESEADLFISLHADSIKRRHIRGLSVYTLSERASDQEAADLAEKENKADLIAGLDLSHETREVTNILIDLAQRETMNESARFASILVNEFKRQTKLLRNSHRFAGFRVLKAPDVPSVLVEMGFLSNREDEKALLKRAYRDRLGAALTKAVEAYFSRIEEAYRR